MNHGKLKHKNYASPTLNALKQLQHQLHHLEWETSLHDGPHPFLRISLNAAYREYVFVAQHDAPHYTWGNTSFRHPLDDPAGAAGRIVRDLALRRVEQGLARCRR